MKNQKPYKEFLEYLKDDNVVENEQPFGTNGLRSIGEESKEINTEL